MQNEKPALPSWEVWAQENDGRAVETEGAATGGDDNMPSSDERNPHSIVNPPNIGNMDHDAKRSHGESPPNDTSGGLTKRVVGTDPSPMPALLGREREKANSSGDRPPLSSSSSNKESGGPDGGSEHSPWEVGDDPSDVETVVKIFQTRDAADNAESAASGPGDSAPMRRIVTFEDDDNGCMNNNGSNNSSNGGGSSGSSSSSSSNGVAGVEEGITCDGSDDSDDSDSAYRRRRDRARSTPCVTCDPLFVVGLLIFIGVLIVFFPYFFSVTFPDIQRRQALVDGFCAAERIIWEESDACDKCASHTGTVHLSAVVFAAPGGGISPEAGGGRKSARAWDRSLPTAGSEGAAGVGKRSTRPVMDTETYALASIVVGDIDLAPLTHDYSGRGVAEFGDTFFNDGAGDGLKIDAALVLSFVPLLKLDKMDCFEFDEAAGRCLKPELQSFDVFDCKVWWRGSVGDRYNGPELPENYDARRVAAHVEIQGGKSPRPSSALSNLRPSSPLTLSTSSAPRVVRAGGTRDTKRSDDTLYDTVVGDVDDNVEDLVRVYWDGSMSSSALASAVVLGVVCGLFSITAGIFCLIGCCSGNCNVSSSGRGCEGAALCPANMDCSCAGGDCAGGCC